MRGIVTCIESNIDNLKRYSKVYIIVRNPISRVISFYRDKFIMYRHLLVQPNQIAMLKYASAEKIQSGDFSFSDLVNAIQDGYSNEHIYNFSNMKPVFDVLKKPFTVLKLDSLDFSSKLGELLGTGVPHIHKSSSVKKSNQTK